MNRERRAVLRGIAALTGAGVGSGGTVAASGDSKRTMDEQVGERAVDERGNERTVNQEIDTELPPGVVLFDLNGDGEFSATVERAPREVRGDGHRNAIHITSGGRETVDFAASVVQPRGRVTLGDVERLRYDYYEGTDDVDGRRQAGAAAPGQTFVVVENADGRHGAYLTYDHASDDRPAGEWLTHNVYARLTGDTAGTSGWFEYTPIEADYDGKTFDDFVGRFGTDARLLRVGVGLGSAANPTTLDVFYDALTIDGETRQFPISVEKRVAGRDALGVVRQDI